jgi:3-oxoadipate enol-lactonase
VEFPRTTVTVAGGRPIRLSVIDITPEQPRGTIVMVHGAGGDAVQWHRQINHFAPHYRVVAPDLRGHGQSDVPRSNYSLEEFLWDFSEVLEQLRVTEPFNLMAHSFGGPVALTFAASQARRIARLVLVATAPEMHLNRFHEAILKLHAPLFVLKRILAGTLFPWRGWGLLPNVTIPTLVLGGQFDFIVPPHVLQRMAGMMPTAQFELVRYTGHLPHLERPESVNRYLDSFLHAKRRSWRDEQEEDA